MTDDDTLGGSAPDWVEAAVRLVLGDLFPGERPPFARVEWTEPSTVRDGLIRLVADDGEGIGYSIPAGFDREGLLHLLAEQLPEYLPELTVAWGRALPPCPGHGHPAVSDWRDEAGPVWWRCPADGRWLAVVGELGSVGR